MQPRPSKWDHAAALLCAAVLCTRRVPQRTQQPAVRSSHLLSLLVTSQIHPPSPSLHPSRMSASYTAVPRDETELNEVALENANLAGSAPEPEDFSHETAAAGPAQQPLTKRAVYSPHRVELRTPRLPGETDAAYKRRINSAYWSALAHSLGWVLAALAIIYYTDLIDVIRYDQRLNHSFLSLAGLSGGVLLVTILYLALWVPFRATRPIVDLAKHAPVAIPVGTAAGVATFVL